MAQAQPPELWTNMILLPGVPCPGALHALPVTRLARSCCITGSATSSKGCPERLRVDEAHRPEIFTG